ncbi:endoribonuclease ysh1 [Clathrus columnatus]|uniref:Endoribonuclease YSH1 n=1 Tax=Clathrus columnatus TaxID=1419009 RepID=A0AAV4ZYJ6_9AGAM|nr:endoribonuclease ysh1 [Clathrus columnatus]
MANATDSPTLSVTLLGAGQEVGRSCCVLQYRGKTVVCDAGIHPAHSGMASLPFVDELDWSTVDAILITHFHLDHAASLTYIMEKTNFKDGKGKVYMTHPTKAVYKFIMQDYVRMSSASVDPLFTPLDLSLSLPNVIPVSAHQLISPCPGLSFTPYHAGHVVGACMYMIDVAGLKVLYTGDYSREEDRHLVKAEVPPIRPDVLIVESTYGVQSLEARDVKEQRFMSLVHQIIRRGGHVLLPVFAIGRAQELLLILDDYWKAHPDLHNVPVYYASNLAKKCMAVYQTYIHTMNANIRARFARRDNPFVFKHISHLPQTRGLEKKIADGPPCVVLASPGMLQSGMSRELLELWAPDSRNGLIVTGYSVEGTMARDIMNEPEEIMSLKGNPIPRRLSVDYISFSAHVDYSQNSEFIEQVKAQHVVLVHGEQTAMGRLKAALQARYKDRDEDAIGKLATNPPQPDSTLSGLLVSKDYSYTLLDPQDLRDFTGLSTCVVTQRQKIAIGVGWSLIQWHLEGMFGYVETSEDKDDTPMMRIMDALIIKQTGPHEICLEWDSSASNDMIADAAIALLYGIDSSPASVKLTTHKHHHPHATSTNEEFAISRIQRLAMFLESHFGDIELHTVDTSHLKSEEGMNSKQSSRMLIRVDGCEASIDLSTLRVDSDHETLKKRVESVLDMAVATISSLAESYTSGIAEQITTDEKEDITFNNIDGDVYQYDGQSNNNKIERSYPKVEEDASADGTEDSEEVLEVIG